MDLLNRETSLSRKESLRHYFHMSGIILVPHETAFLRDEANSRLVRGEGDLRVRLVLVKRSGGLNFMGKIAA